MTMMKKLMEYAEKKYRKYRHEDSTKQYFCVHQAMEEFGKSENIISAVISKAVGNGGLLRTNMKYTCEAQPNIKHYFYIVNVKPERIQEVPRRKWTAEDDQTLEILASRNVKSKEIAETMGKSLKQVEEKLKTLPLTRKVSLGSDIKTVEISIRNDVITVKVTKK